MFLGYSCATIFADLLNLGNPQSGRDVYPCTHFQSEVHELWTFDIHTFQWTYIHLVNDSYAPPAREQHVAAEIDGNLIIFGGKERLFPVDPTTGGLLIAPHTDFIYGDLWMLQVQKSVPYRLLWSSNDSSVLPIPQDGRLFSKLVGSNSTMSDLGDGVNARNGLCTEKVVVKVFIFTTIINIMSYFLTLLNCCL